MSRILRVGVLVVAFGIAGIASSAGARCSARGNCSDEIAACTVAQDCAGQSTAREQRRCARLCKRAVLQACRSGSASCGSPSGAFLD